MGRSPETAFDVAFPLARGISMVFAYYHEQRPEARLRLWVPWTRTAMETTEPQVYFVSGFDGIGSGWHGRYGIVHGHDGTTKLQIWFNYQGGRHASRTHVIPLPASSNPDLSEVPYFRLAFHALFSMRVGMVLKGCVESDPAKPQITMVLIAKEVATPPPGDILRI